MYTPYQTGAGTYGTPMYPGGTPNAGFPGVSPMGTPGGGIIGGGQTGGPTGGQTGGFPTGGFPAGGFPAGGTQATPPVGTAPAIPTIPGQPPLEQSFVENILRLNLGKMATFYMTYENNTQWNAKIFRGRIEAAGRDHIVISDPQTGMRFLLLMVNLDYVTFEEELKYSYTFGGGGGGR
ncbi:spore coat protein GerQ [Paenibacillus sp. P26]|nr:spore coat protein GerQ [Paenibacillus sp. P26]UUZ89880.1 spore coat protein GerQ [Paenibacillus sp. P25]